MRDRIRFQAHIEQPEPVWLYGVKVLVELTVFVLFLAGMFAALLVVSA